MFRLAIIASTDIKIKGVSDYQRVARSRLYITRIPCMKILTDRKKRFLVFPIPMETVFAPTYQDFISFLNIQAVANIVLRALPNGEVA